MCVCVCHQQWRFSGHEEESGPGKLQRYEQSSEGDEQMLSYTRLDIVVLTAVRDICESKDSHASTRLKLRSFKV